MFCGLLHLGVLALDDDVEHGPGILIALVFILCTKSGAAPGEEMPNTKPRGYDLAPRCRVRAQS